MIYLIDDKRERQNDYGYSTELLETYKDVLIPIYKNSELQEIKNELFKENNIILFHDSFFENPENIIKKNSVLVKNDIINHSNSTNCIVVFFSGSIGSRHIEGNIASLPVGILYGNLDAIIEYYRSKSTDLLDIIVYGKNRHFEQLALIKKKLWEILYNFNNDEKVQMTPVLSLYINEISKLCSKEIITNDVTISFLKFQINQLQHELSDLYR